MRKSITRSSASMAAFLLLVCGGSAQAALVNFTLSGTVDGTFGGSPYGLNVGSTITASGVFDDAAISSSSHTVYFDQSHSSNALSISAGTLFLNQTQDDFYAAGGSPILEFNSVGSLIGLSFSSLPFTSGALSIYVEDPAFNSATGAWNANTFSMTPAVPVPVPAAVWLLGSGLLGLAGVARRKWTA
jgi:hypothetical protein